MPFLKSSPLPRTPKPEKRSGQKGARLVDLMELRNMLGICVEIYMEYFSGNINGNIGKLPGIMGIICPPNTYHG
jgi:hypothetical protein